MKKIAAALLAGAMAIGLLCGFTTDTGEEDVVEYVRKQWQTEELISEIVVTETQADVIVRAAEDEQTTAITIEYADTADEELYAFSIEEESLSIQKQREKPQTNQGLFNIGRLKLFPRAVPVPDNGVDTTLIITLPQKEYASILVANNAGNITFEGIEAQNLAAKVSNGNMLFDGCFCVDMTAQNIHGNVTFSNSETKNLSVNSSYGDVAFNGDTAESISVQNGYGSIIFTNALASSYRCSTSYGDIKGTLRGSEADYSATYERKMVYGEMAEIKTVEQTEAQHIVSADGSAKVIDFSTNYGDIKIEFANPTA